MRFFGSFKALMLAVLIVIGSVIHYGTARAADTQTLTVAGGCFWCVEADFEKVPGVIEAVSGFTGGDIVDPTYKQVTAGGTGHLEAVQITFDPAQISREQLLTLFMRSIDPTDAGGQFCDRGHSYTTAIFAETPAETTLAKRVISEAQSELGQSIVTPVLDSGPFYPADAYHQDFYKSSKIIFTRFGPKRRSEAYKSYREACKRDERVRALWGDDAPFIGS